MNTRKNDGITMISLAVAIVVLSIIAGITITASIIGVDGAKESAQISELTMIQHAILERYTSSILTKEQLPGTTIEKGEVQTIIEEINDICNENITLKGTEYTEYKRLTPQDLEKMGIEKGEDTYIVNYKTGEVINETVKVTESKKALYIFAKEE